MAAPWTSDDLDRLARAEELEIATYRPDQTLRAFVPIWVVVADGTVVVRTWHRRTTGWYGHAADSGRARVRAQGLETDVVVEDVGRSKPAGRGAVDAAYRAKYGRYGDQSVAGMVGDEAAGTTLVLRPAAPGRG